MENLSNKELLLRLKAIINNFNKGKEILSELDSEYQQIVDELKKRLGE